MPSDQERLSGDKAIREAVAKAEEAARKLAAPADTAMGVNTQLWLEHEEKIQTRREKCADGEHEALDLPTKHFVCKYCRVYFLPRL